MQRTAVCKREMMGASSCCLNEDIWTAGHSEPRFHRCDAGTPPCTASYVPLAQPPCASNFAVSHPACSPAKFTSKRSNTVAAKRNNLVNASRKSSAFDAEHNSVCVTLSTYTILGFRQSPACPYYYHIFLVSVLQTTEKYMATRNAEAPSKML